MTLAASMATAQTGQPDGGVTLADDLRTVIILAGYPCRKVSQFSQTDRSEYHVSCEMDRQYLVSVSEEKGLVVENRSGSAAVEAPSETKHDAFMKKQLSAIVNLAGHECETVLNYERLEEKGNIVTCQDHTIFRIHVTPEGKVAVEKQQTDK